MLFAQVNILPYTYIVSPVRWKQVEVDLLQHVNNQIPGTRLLDLSMEKRMFLTETE